MSSGSDIVSINEIPTLADLYQKGQIPEAEDKPYFNHDQGHNKRISIWRGR